MEREALADATVDQVEEMFRQAVTDFREELETEHETDSRKRASLAEDALIHYQGLRASTWPPDIEVARDLVGNILHWALHRRTGQ